MDPKEKAEKLYLRGLHLHGQFSASHDTESLKEVAELWQEAWELYREIGDNKKARELEKLMVSLYKKEYSQVLESKKKRNVTGIFKDWFLFFKIGCFGFGGPMAVFTLLEDELVFRRNILTEEDFLEGAVLGDILPGPVTMDIVTYTGFKLRGWWGAAVSTLAFIVPSFILMLILSILYEKYSITPEIKDVLKCLGAAVTGLILSVGMRLCRSEVKSYREMGIFTGAFVLSLFFRLDIVIVVGLAGLVGLIVYMDERRRLAGAEQPAGNDGHNDSEEVDEDPDD